MLYAEAPTSEFARFVEGSFAVADAISSVGDSWICFPLVVEGDPSKQPFYCAECDDSLPHCSSGTLNTCT